MFIRWKVPIAKGLVALVAALTVALMLACGGGSPSISECPPPGEAPNTADSAGDGGLETDFCFTLYQGEDVLGGRAVYVSHLLDKPTIVNFWAGLCPPCREEMPHFQEFYDEFEERISFVGVDVGQFTGLGNPEDAQELLENLEVTYPAGFTEDAQAVKEYIKGNMPTTVFITPAGEVFRSWAGYLSKDKLTEITEEMLAAG